MRTCCEKNANGFVLLFLWQARATDESQFHGFCIGFAWSLKKVFQVSCSFQFAEGFPRFLQVFLGFLQLCLGG